MQTPLSKPYRKQNPAGGLSSHTAAARPETLAAPKANLALRTTMMLVGVLLIGLCVGLFRMSMLGTDPFTCMNMGVSSFFHMSFGNWQVVINVLLFAIIFKLAPHTIGAGTFFNMFCVGYLADFFCWLVLDAMHVTMTLPLRFAFLAIGTLCIGIGCALYMEADMGIAPYDAIAIVLHEYFPHISFSKWRIASDGTVLVIGVIFGSMAGVPLGSIAGLGTVISVCLMGPIIAFFRARIAHWLASRAQAQVR